MPEFAIKTTVDANGAIRETRKLRGELDKVGPDTERSLRQGKGASDDFRKSLGLTAGEARNLRQNMKTFGGDLSALGAGLTAAVTLPLTGLAVAAIKTAGDLEQTEIAFETMLGSAEAAGTFLEDLRQFAATTPFEFADLVEAAKRMKALGFQTEQVIPTMTAIGNATAALGGGGELINRITLALGQMQAKGKVSAEEMRQLAEAGIPAWQLLADAIGITVPEAMKLAEQGAIDGAGAVVALTEGLAESFAGLMDKQSKTLLGQISNVQDQLFFILEDLGAALIPIGVDLMERFVFPALEGIRNLVEEFRNLPAGTQQTIVALSALFAVVGPLAVGVGLLVSALAAVSVPVVAVVAGVTAAAAALVIYRTEIGEAIAGTQGLWQEFIRGDGIMATFVRGLQGVGMFIVEMARNAIGFLIDKVEALVGWFGDLFDLLRQRGRQELEKQAELHGQVAIDMEGARQAAENEQRAMGQLLGELERTAPAIQNVDDKTNNLIRSMEGAKGAIEKFSDTATAKLLAVENEMQRTAEFERLVAAQAGQMADVLANTTAPAINETVESSRNFNIELERLKDITQPQGVPQDVKDLGEVMTRTKNEDVEPLKQTMQEVSTVITDLGKDMVDVLVSGGSPGEKFKEALNAIRDAVLRLVAQEVMGLLLGQLGKLLELLPGLGKLKDVLGGIFTKNAFPGLPGAPPINVPSPGGVPTPSGGGGGGGGVPFGGATGIGFAVGGPIGAAIGAVVDVGLQVAQLLGGAQRETSLNAIELNTRRLERFIGGREDQGVLGVLFTIDESLGFLTNRVEEARNILFDNVFGTLREIRDILSGGIAVTGPVVQQIADNTGATAQQIPQLGEALKFPTQLPQLGQPLPFPLQQVDVTNLHRGRGALPFLPQLGDPLRFPSLPPTEAREAREALKALNMELQFHKERIADAQVELAELTSTLPPFGERSAEANDKIRELNQTLQFHRGQVEELGEQMAALSEVTLAADNAVSDFADSIQQVEARAIPGRSRTHDFARAVDDVSGSTASATSSLTDFERIVRLLGAAGGSSRLEILARQNPFALLGLAGDNPFATIAAGGLTEEEVIKLVTSERARPPRGRGALPRLQTGGFIEQTGVAVVHRGERVLPPGTPPVTVNFAPTIHVGAGGSRAAQDVAIVTRRLVRTELVPAIEQALRKNTGGLRTAIRTI